MTAKNDSISFHLGNDRQEQPSFWAELCPHLTISNEGVLPIAQRNKSYKGVTLDSAQAERKREKLISNGYSLVDEHFDPALVERIRQGIELLHNLNLPATFILLFEETWDLARASRDVMKQCTHPINEFNFDLLAWYIEPGTLGFSVSHIII